MRLADRTPICVSTTWLSAERFPDAGRVFADVRSMTKLLAHYGVRDYRRASTRITAAIADATDAARLDLALGRPVLVVDTTDVDADGKPLVTKRSRFAAERVEFLVEKSGGRYAEGVRSHHRLDTSGGRARLPVTDEAQPPRAGR